MFSANAIIGKDKTPVVYQAVPAQRPYSLTATSVTRTSFFVNFIGGDPTTSGFIIVMLLARSGSTNQNTNTTLSHFQDIHNVGPVNGKTYTGSTVFGSGDTVRGTVYGDKKFYVIRNVPSGSAPAFSVTGLSGSHAYAIRSYSYTGSGVNTIYNLNTITSPATNYLFRSTPSI